MTLTVHLPSGITNASMVVRGGGETRKNTLVVFGLSFTVALMLAMPVSAGGRTIWVEDRSGDLMQNLDWETGEITLFWGDNTPVAQVGYFDMLSFWLSQKGQTYTFGMEVAANLPEEGSALPTGFKQVMWIMWIENEPWNLVYNPDAEILFTISLVYDGVKYFAEMRTGATSGPVLTSLPFSVDGSKLEIQFSSGSIGDLESFWWSVGTRVQWGPLGTSGFWTFEGADPGAYPGQVWWDIPWGSPVWE